MVAWWDDKDNGVASPRLNTLLTLAVVRIFNSRDTYLDINMFIDQPTKSFVHNDGGRSYMANRSDLHMI